MGNYMGVGIKSTGHCREIRRCPALLFLSVFQARVRSGKQRIAFTSSFSGFPSQKGYGVSRPIQIPFKALGVFRRKRKCRPSASGSIRPVRKLLRSTNTNPVQYDWQAEALRSSPGIFRSIQICSSAEPSPSCTSHRHNCLYRVCPPLDSRRFSQSKPSNFNSASLRSSPPA